MSWWTSRTDGTSLLGDEPLDLLHQALQQVVEAYLEDHGRPPSEAELCLLLEEALNQPDAPWHAPHRPGIVFTVGAVAPEPRIGTAEATSTGKDEGGMVTTLPKPGVFFRIPLGRGLPAFGQVLAVGDGHVVVRTLHTTTAKPTQADLLAAEDLMPVEAVKASAFLDKRWQVLDSPAAAEPRSDLPEKLSPVPPIPFELKIARRRTAIGMGPDSDA